MAAITVDSIKKTFAKTNAVDGISFEVNNGEIFGLIGPNGAGKTTTIRMILDIFQPDSGKITVLGGRMDDSKKNRIGYLPEERGLYQDIPLERCLTYLASLKGMADTSIKPKLDAYLYRFELESVRLKKVKELSKGMQQKAQLIATLIHSPDIVIIDEPFSALDPVNTQMVRDLLMEERARGTAIIMSTHQMHQAEELCDRLVLVDNGKAALYGVLNDIKREFSNSEIIVQVSGEFPTQIPGVQAIEAHNSAKKLQVETGVNPQTVLNSLIGMGVVIERFELALPSLDEIFIKVVTAREDRNA